MWGPNRSKSGPGDFGRIDAARELDEAATRIREEVDAGRVPQRELVHGVMILLAGFLLLLPGFVTDAVGFLLFVPAFRDAAWRFLSSRIAARVDIRGVDLGRARQRDTRTIDLDEEEYSRSPDPDSPWKRD